MQLTLLSSKTPLVLLKLALGLIIYLNALSAQAIVEISSDRLLQRQQYQDAIHSIKLGRLKNFNKLEPQLRDYPLYPYLKFAELKKRLRKAPNKEIIAFINKYAGTPLATRLHYSWQHQLVRKKDWKTLVENYLTSKNIKMQCHYAHALNMENQPMAAYDVIEQIWLTGKSLPKVCDKVIKLGLKSGRITQDLVLERIRLAMQSNRLHLAKYLKQYVNQEDQHWIDLWIKVRRKPELILSDSKLKSNIPIVRWILIDALIRISKKDALEGARLWSNFKLKFSFNTQEENRLVRRLTLYLSQIDDVDSIKWLNATNYLSDDSYLTGIHIISSIKDRDWESAVDWLDRLNSEERHSEKWRYWRARVYEAMGRLEEARNIYHLNANERSYYGFLAADRNGLNYQFGDKPLIYSAEEISALEQNPAILRARELYLLNQIVDARREWHYAIQRMDSTQILIAAQAADQWGWHDRAIITFGRAKYWDDLKRRFPLVHQNLVVKQAQGQKINPAWAFAIIRQESAFTSDARSHAGAMGLMQLLPRTALQVARNNQVKYRNRFDLLNINTNVKLGVRYLKKVSDHFNGNNVLATAAYNAGQYRVNTWLPKAPVSADIWVETVPFNETRDYLKRVLTYTIIYEQRLGHSPKSILQNMPIIQAKKKI
ncbi:MAG: transglycosylase SLT domain-containing protein [Gammaproteobacteria bacterium]